MRYRPQPEFAAQGVNFIAAMLCHGDDIRQQSSGRDVVLDKLCGDGIYRGKPSSMARASALNSFSRGSYRDPG